MEPFLNIRLETDFTHSTVKFLIVSTKLGKTPKELNETTIFESYNLEKSFALKQLLDFFNDNLDLFNHFIINESNPTFNVFGEIFRFCDYPILLISKYPNLKIPLMQSVISIKLDEEN